MRSPAKRTGTSERPIEVTPDGVAGAQLGPYRLCLELASGGMATVYLARASAGVGPNRSVALKVVHSHLASDQTFIEMFVDEAEIAARIHHANVCTIFDYDVADGQYYIAMEYLVGESMASIWRRLSRQQNVDLDRLARRVARALSDVCEGLHAAHELTDADGEPLNIVHRDVSPENVFLTYDGIAKVVDFGVASASRKRHRTRTGIIKGKFAYVAPELLRQGKHQPDRRADIWGLGVVAWELLTGKRLFRRETEIDTLRAVYEGSISRPSEVRPGLPKEIDEIVMRALSRDPDDRYATARELGKALARFAAGGEQVVTADLAEWMEELFPAGKERNARLLELADQIEAEGRDETPLRVERSPSGRPVAPPPLPEREPPGQTPSAASDRNATSLPPPLRSPADGWMMPTTYWPGAHPPPARHGPPSWLALALASMLSAGVGAVGAGLLLRAPAAAAAQKAAGISTPTSAEAQRVPVEFVPVSPVAPREYERSDGARAEVVSDAYLVEVGDGDSGEVVLRIRPNERAQGKAQPASDEGGSEPAPARKARVVRAEPRIWSYAPADLDLRSWHNAGQTDPRAFSSQDEKGR